MKSSTRNQIISRSVFVASKYSVHGCQPQRRTANHFYDDDEASKALEHGEVVEKLEPREEHENGEQLYLDV